MILLDDFWSSLYASTAIKVDGIREYYIYLFNVVFLFIINGSCTLLDSYSFLKWTCDWSISITSTNLDHILHLQSKVIISSCGKEYFSLLIKAIHISWYNQPYAFIIVKNKLTQRKFHIVLVIYITN